MPDIQFSEFLHSASIATGTTLQSVNASGDTDGRPRWLAGVRTEVGADMQRIHLESDSWGNRVIGMPPPGAGGALIGPRTTWLPRLIPVKDRQAVRSFATQDNVGAQTTAFTAIYLADNSGDGLPAVLQARVAMMHTEFRSGTATNGSFPPKSSATATAIALNENDGIQWIPSWSAAVGTLVQARWGYPLDRGQGPTIGGASDVFEENTWQPINWAQTITPGDNLDLLAQDASGSAVSAWLWMLKDNAGLVPHDAYWPFY